MSQHDIDLKVYRGRLKRAHEQAADKITQEMLNEFEADVASGEPERSLLARGRAQRWLADFDSQKP